MANGVKNKLTPFCLKFIAARTITECEYQAIKLADHTHVIMVRYADDSVIGFQHEEEAGQFLQAMRERLAQFGLALHPQKTRLIEFGRYAEQRRKKKGLGRPETF